MKKFIVAICIAVVAAGAAFSVKSVVDNSKENSFIKRNVEALSRGEGATVTSCLSIWGSCKMDGVETQGPAVKVNL